MMGNAPTLQERRVCEAHWATVPEGGGGWLGLRVDIVPNSFREKPRAGKPLPTSLAQCPRSPRKKSEKVRGDFCVVVWQSQRKKTEPIAWTLLGHLPGRTKRPRMPCVETSTAASALLQLSVSKGGAALNATV